MLSCSKGLLERRCLRSLLTEWQTELGDRRASRRESLLHARNASGAWELSEVSRSLDEGLYMDHLRRWWRIFTRERVHVVLSDALFSEPLSAVRRAIPREPPGRRAAHERAVSGARARSALVSALRWPLLTRARNRITRAGEQRAAGLKPRAARRPARKRKHAPNK